jgi:uncharacterized protein (DUF4415 family)
MVEKRGYDAADLAAVSDNPEWTEEDFAKARPFAEVFPSLAAGLGRDGPAARRERVMVGIDRDLVEGFRKTGPDWEEQLNAALRSLIEPSA